MTFFTVILATIPATEVYSVSSHPFKAEWGQSGLLKPGHFQNPQTVTVDEQGNTYVTDLGNKRVQKFSNDGIFLLAWGSSGTGAGQFHAPSGIAYNENHVYVVDSQLHKVQKFDTEGNFVIEWGTQGKKVGQFRLPNGITVGGNNTLYVVDTGNHRIQQFGINGTFLKEFGESGSADHQLISPIGITIDNSGTLYVSDPGSHSIKKFDSDGTFVNNNDNNIGGLPIRAQGLAATPTGNIYVADTGNDRILLLDPEGNTISIWGSMGIQSGQFKMPKDVALDSNGNLFVVDSNGHRIQKFGTPNTSSNPTSSPSTPISEQNPQKSGISVEPFASPQQQTTPVVGDLTKPSITPPNDLVIEANWNAYSS